MITDIVDALAVLRAVHDESRRHRRLRLARGRAGPRPRHRRHDRRGAALHDRIAKPNLLVKIPATVEGVPRHRDQMIAEGKSINVTLIFSLERYDAVIEAYLSGLEALRRLGATTSPGGAASRRSS